jgi:hypothetical protein
MSTVSVATSLAAAVAFVDHGRTHRHDGFDGALERAAEIVLQGSAVGQHGIGIFVRLHGDDEFGDDFVDVFTLG